MTGEKIASIVFVDAVDNDFDYGVFFLGAALGYHHEDVVGDALGPILGIKNTKANDKHINTVFS